MALCDVKFRPFFQGIHPWGYTIGDIIGLFPVAYADRLKYAKTPGIRNTNNSKKKLVLQN